jgi:hypothetical protein
MGRGTEHNTEWGRGEEAEGQHGDGEQDLYKDKYSLHEGVLN